MPKRVIGKIIAYSFPFLAIGGFAFYEYNKNQEFDKKYRQLRKDVAILETEKQNTANQIYFYKNALGALDGRVNNLDELVQKHENRSGIPNYDYNVSEQLENLKNYSKVIETELELNIGLGGEIKTTKAIRLGRGLVIRIDNKNYFLTANHIVTPPGRLKEEIVNEKASLLLDGQVSGAKLEIKNISRVEEADFALYEIPDDSRIQALPDDLLGDSNLRVGEKIFLVGDPDLRGIFIREGIIGRITWENIADKTFKEFEDCVGVTGGASGGDSGTFFAKFYLDGILRVEGIILKVYTNNSQAGIAVKIKPFLTLAKEGIAEYHKKTEQAEREQNSEIDSKQEISNEVP